MKDGFGELIHMHYGVQSQLGLWFDQQSAVLGPKLFVTTHYSGMGTVEHVLHRLSKAFDSAPVVFHSAHEIDEKVRGMLLQAQHLPNHIFGDIAEMFPRHIVDQMFMICQVLRERASFQAKNAETPGKAKRIFAEASERCMLKLLKVAQQAVKGPLPERGFCYVHNAWCPFLPETNEDDFVLEGAGNSCVAFSQQGSQSRWLHPSSVITALWMAHTESRKVDMIVQECSSLFNTAEAFKVAFKPEDGWDTTVLKLKCQDVGVPMVRWRNYSWTIRGPRMVLVKKFTRDDFLNIASTPVELDGHDFFCAGKTMVQSFLAKQVIALRGSLAGQPNPLRGEHALEVGARVRLQGYQNLLPTNVASLEKSMVGVVDLSQNVSVRGRLSTDLPSFLCHSKLWSQYKGREMLPVEMMNTMGWPVAGLIGDFKEEEAPWETSFLMSQRPSEVAKVTGNQMHARLFGCFLGFCLSLTAERPVNPP